MRLAVLDDEKAFINEFSDIAARIMPDAEIIGFDKEDKLIQSLSGDKVDCVFMDICLDNTSGIDSAKHVKDISPDTPVVFVTGYPQQYCQSIFLEHFDFEPFAFVCKPVEPNVLQRVFEKLESKGKDKSATITLHSGRQDVILNTQEIIYVESNRWYVLVHTKNKVITVRAKLSDIEQLLPESFISSHKSYVVNASYVRAFNSSAVTLTDGTELPVSRSHKTDFKQKILSIKGFG
ncbi:MAG: LytTR family DNA-binding domain-containing protein [Ruminococcus sp.]|jgi:DNA-binding LytR/AlgR family response regulator|nr:response regulator transcription factor [Ruminococcus sp.]MBQ3936895.1 response regulator transcription factor [Ruminococcus sp.]MCR5478509.1 LytTR family DNA-binding domain-containing protein [Ruminococcus sp.]